jgi:hypothetical protein
MDEREIRAFSVAPLPWVVPLLLAVGVKAVVGDTGDAGYAGVFVAMVVFVLLSYFATLVIGAPIHLVLKLFEKTGLIYYVSLAVLPFVLLAGAIAAWTQLAPTSGTDVNPHGLYMNGGVAVKWTLVFAAIASLSATTFWYAGVRQPKP